MFRQPQLYRCRNAYPLVFVALDMYILNALVSSLSLEGVICKILLCCSTNCKLAVQSKVGLQRLAQLGYSNVHRTSGALRAHLGLQCGTFMKDRSLHF